MIMVANRVLQALGGTNSDGKGIFKLFHDRMYSLTSFQILSGSLARLYRLTDSYHFTIGEFFIYFVNVLVLDTKQIENVIRTISRSY